MAVGAKHFPVLLRKFVKMNVELRGMLYDKPTALALANGRLVSPASSTVSGLVIQPRMGSAHRQDLARSRS
jgi:hypothetical protein